MKKTLKKLISFACIITILASSMPVFAAGYEVTMEPSIDYIDGKNVEYLEEGSYEYELFGPSIEMETFFFPTPFFNGASVVHNNVYIMPEMFPLHFSKFSYLVDVYGNRINIGEYDLLGVYPHHISNETAEFYGTTYPYIEFNHMDGVDAQGYITAVKDGKCGLIDTQGNVLIPCEYTSLDSETYEKHGIIDESYRESIPYSGKYFKPYYYPYSFLTLEDRDAEETVCFYNGLAVVAQTEDESSKVGIVDEDDNIVVPFIYDMITPCYDNACWVLKDGKWGIIRVSNSKVSVNVNNTPITFDQNPLIINGRTLAPVRAIFEALGATVEWKNDTREVISTKGDVTITMAIDSTTMYKNGNPITLDVAPQIIGGRTLVPVRAIAEAFNCKVEWNNDTQTVIITEQ